MSCIELKILFFLSDMDHKIDIYVICSVGISFLSAITVSVETFLSI